MNESQTHTNTHTVCMQCVSASFAPGSHSYACQCLFVDHGSDERWLVWYVFCVCVHVYVCVRDGVCMGAGGNVDAWVCRQRELSCVWPVFGYPHMLHV